MIRNVQNVRKQEIEFKKSLFRFSAFFVFILLLGLVTHYALSRIPLEQKVSQALNSSERFKVSVHNPHFRFAQGVMPIFGIGFDRIEAVEVGCESKRLLAHNATLVFNPWRLLLGQIKFGWAKIGFLELDYPRGCHSASDATTESKLSVKYEADSISKIQENVKPSKSLQGPPIKEEALRDLFDQVEMIGRSNKLSYILVDSFAFKGLYSINNFLEARGRFSVKIKKKIEVEVKIKELKYKEKKVPLGSTTLTAFLDPLRMQLLLTSSIREGQLDVEVAVNKNENFSSSMSFALKKVPVSSISLDDREINYLWSTCAGSLKSAWIDILSTPLEVESCRFDGPYGEVQFEEVQASLKSIQSFKAEVKDVDLDKVINSKRNLFFSGVLANYGTLSTKVFYQMGSWSIEGLLENSEFIFSRNQLRDIQLVKKMPFFFKGEKDQWQFEVSGIELDGGEVDGNIQVQLNPNDLSAKGKISIHRLMLKPKIYQLMLNSQPADFKVYGKFDLLQKKIQSWSVMFATPHLVSDHYEFQNLKIRGQSLRSGTSQIRLTSQKGLLTQDSFIRHWLEPTLLQSPSLEGPLVFRESSARLSVSKNLSLKLKRGYVRFKNGWQLSAEGKKDLQNQFQGWLQWDRPKQKELRWKYQGSFEKGSWIPQNLWMLTWLESHSSYLKDHPNVNYKIKGKKSLGNRINEASKKAIDKVKSVLGTDEPSQKK